MKKYVKPVLIFEQFELSKHIAEHADLRNQLNGINIKQ